VREFKDLRGFFRAVLVKRYPDNLRPVYRYPAYWYCAVCVGWIDPGTTWLDRAGYPRHNVCNQRVRTKPFRAAEETVNA
jgi:hypothetical protein